MSNDCRGGIPNNMQWSMSNDCRGGIQNNMRWSMSNDCRGGITNNMRWSMSNDCVEEYRITCDGVCHIAYKDACRNTFEGAYLIFPDKHVRQMRRPSDNLLFYFDLSFHYQGYMFSFNMFNTIELNEISDKHTFLINLNHSMASCHNGQKLLLLSRIDYIY